MEKLNIAHNSEARVRHDLTITPVTHCVMNATE